MGQVLCRCWRRRAAAVALSRLSEQAQREIQQLEQDMEQLANEVDRLKTEAAEMFVRNERVQARGKWDRQLQVEDECTAKRREWQTWCKRLQTARTIPATVVLEEYDTNLVAALDRYDVSGTTESTRLRQDRLAALGADVVDLKAATFGALAAHVESGLRGTDIAAERESSVSNETDLAIQQYLKHKLQNTTTPTRPPHDVEASTPIVLPTLPHDRLHFFVRDIQPPTDIRPTLHSGMAPVFSARSLRHHDRTKSSSGSIVHASN